MDGHTFLSWNIPNLISVWLIIIVGVVALKFAASIWQKKTAG